MKNQLQLSIAIIIFLLAIPLISTAQSDSSTPSGYFWVGVDLSKSSLTLRDHDLTGKTRNINLNFNKGIHLFSFQAGFSKHENKDTYSSLVNIFGGGSASRRPNQFPKSSFTQFNLTYGLISPPSRIRFFAATGLSWINANYSMSRAFNDKTEFSGFGLPIKVGTILSFGYFGLGLNYFNNLNSFSNCSGVSFSLMIGVMK